MYYNKRFIVSGGIYELYEYEHMINSDGPGVTGGRKKGQNSQVHREETMRKARTEIRRLINANIHQWTDADDRRVTSKFMTFTFKENVADIRQSNLMFSKFMKRLSYDSGYKIKYLAVIEFQERGAVHYHVVIFNMPYIPQKELLRLWGHGYVWVNKINNVTNVGAYVCKYMSKDNVTDKRLVGQKLYFKSTGLLQPEIIIDPDRVDELKKFVDPERKVYEKEFRSEWVGNIKYAQYNHDKRR